MDNVTVQHIKSLHHDNQTYWFLQGECRIKKFSGGFFYEVRIACSGLFFPCSYVRRSPFYDTSNSLTLCESTTPGTVCESLPLPIESLCKTALVALTSKDVISFIPSVVYSIPHFPRQLVVSLVIVFFGRHTCKSERHNIVCL